MRVVDPSKSLSEVSVVCIGVILQRRLSSHNLLLGAEVMNLFGPVFHYAVFLVNWILYSSGRPLLEVGGMDQPLAVCACHGAFAWLQ